MRVSWWADGLPLTTGPAERLSPMHSSLAHPANLRQGREDRAWPVRPCKRGEGGVAMPGLALMRQSRHEYPTNHCTRQTRDWCPAQPSPVLGDADGGTWAKQYTRQGRWQCPAWLSSTLGEARQTIPDQALQEVREMVAPSLDEPHTRKGRQWCPVEGEADGSA